MGGEERRRYPRSRSTLKVVKQKDDGILNHVDNISANGVLCHTAQAVDLMTRMRIVIDLPAPSETRIDAQGVVVRCDPEHVKGDSYRVAILFTKISDEDHDAIHRFVEHDLAGAGGR
jgi:hypothetical protein